MWKISSQFIFFFFFTRFAYEKKHEKSVDVLVNFYPHDDMRVKKLLRYMYVCMYVCMYVAYKLPPHKIFSENMYV